MKLLSSFSTCMDNKHFVLYNTKKCLYYSDDKEYSTDSKAEMASRLGCDINDIVEVYCSINKYPSRKFAGLIEPDKENNRVRMSTWRLEGISLKDSQPFSITSVQNHDTSWYNYKEVGVDWSPYFYFYTTGQISHNDGSTPEKRRANQKPHKVNTAQALTQALTWAYETRYGLLYDLRSEGVSSQRSSETENILRGMGFPETYCVRTDTTYDMQYDISGLALFALTYRKPALPAKEYKDFVATELKPMADDQKFAILRTPKGVMFRFKTTRLPYYAMGENGRLFISSTGKITHYSLKEDPKTKEITWFSNKENPWWFYPTLADNRKAIKDEDVRDLLIDNPKFKYVNEYINANIKMLLKLHISNPYQSSEGLIEFLHMVVKYPVVVDTLLKLGYGNMFTGETAYYANLIDGTEGEDFYVENPIKVETEEYQTWDYDYIQQRCVPTTKTRTKYVVQEIQTGALYHGIFGPLAKGSKFYEILNCTKEQWHCVINTIGEDKLKENTYLFKVLRDAKQWFCGETNDQRYLVPVENRTYKTLKDVSFPMFAEFVQIWYKYMDSLSDRFRTYSEFFSLMHIWGYNNEHAFCDMKNAQDKYKVLKYCIKHDINFHQYLDYLSMREQCQTFNVTAYHEEDWPLLIPKDKIAIFHDRLVELYNNHQSASRREREHSNQCKYEKLLPKIKKFNFELPDNDLCVICPEDLMEIVVEGQKLSHCVGSYTGNVAEGKEVILFLRNKLTKDQPYATIDVTFNTDADKWECRQIHTKHNGDITENDVKFLKEWAGTKNVDTATIKTHYSALCAI